MDWIVAISNEGKGRILSHLSVDDLLYGPTIDDIACGKPQIDGSCGKRVLDIKSQMQFVLDNSPRNKLLYKLGISSLSVEDRMFAVWAESLARELLRKNDYSNADKVAAFIAFDLICDMCTSVGYELFMLARHIPHKRMFGQF